MNKYRLPLLLITVASAFAFSAPVQSAQASPSQRTTTSLWVTSRSANNVSVIDVATNQVTDQFPVGDFPIRIVLTPNRRTAYISNAQSQTVSAIDTVSRTVIATIPVYNIPGESAITPDGKRLFIVHESGLAGDLNHCPVAVINTATNQVIATVLIPGFWAKDIVLSKDARFAYVANFSNGEVDVIDTTTYGVTSIPTGAGSRRICITPSGDRVFVTNNKDASVSAIDTATNQLIATIPVGQGPIGITVTPDGQQVYVTNETDGTVSAIDATTLTVLATTATGDLPQRIVFTRDGTKAFVENGYSDTVSAINTATHQVIATIPVGHRPFTMLANRDTSKVYVCNAEATTVSVIDVPSLTVSNTIPGLGLGPFDLAFGP